MLQNIYLNSTFDDLARRFGADVNFPNELSESSDWVFVIKLCIFTEEICTDSLIRYLKEERLNDWIIKLPLVGGQTGKLPLLKTLELVNSDDANYIQGLADIRNRYAHRIKYSAMRLSDYIESIPNNGSASLKSKFKSVTDLIGDQFEQYNKTSKYWRFVLECGFVMTAMKLAKSSGLMDEIGAQNEVFIHELKINMKNV